MGLGITTSSGPDCRRRSSHTTATLATPRAYLAPVPGLELFALVAQSFLLMWLEKE